MTKMIRPRLAIYQNVIKENQHKATKERAKYIIHEGLESCRGVAQPEWHYQELVEAVVSAERRLVDVLRPHEHLVVPRAQVQLGEESRAMELVQQLIHHGKRELVLQRR